MWLLEYLLIVEVKRSQENKYTGVVPEVPVSTEKTHLKMCIFISQHISFLLAMSNSFDTMFIVKRNV